MVIFVSIFNRCIGEASPTVSVEELRKLNNFSCSPVTVNYGSHLAFEYYMPKTHISKLFKTVSSVDYEVLSTSEECSEWIYDHDFGYVSMTSEVGSLD